jgi:hypothetical protein
MLASLILGTMLVAAFWLEAVIMCDEPWRPGWD